MKFFDMTLAIVFAVLISFGVSSESYAGGGGNDPTGMMRMAAINDLQTIDYMAANFAYHGINDDGGTKGGGGHDPSGGDSDPSPSLDSCRMIIDGEVVIFENRKACLLNKIARMLNNCDNEDGNCEYLLQELERLSDELEN